MPIILAILLAPVAFLIARAAESYRTDKRRSILLNCLLVLMVVAFYAFVFLTNLEPFNSFIVYSKEYSFFSGRYWMMVLVVYLFSPFLWVITIYFARHMLRALRVRKNAVIKRDREIQYYRDALDKIAPGIILFTSELSVDLRRSISSGILKLKLSGYVKERNGRYTCTDKTPEQLYTSEKMLLQLVETGAFDEAAYRRTLKTEALAGKYLVRNRGGAMLRLLRILLAVCIPVVLLVGSFRLDDYAFAHYRIYPDPTEDGYEVYLILDRSEDTEKLMSEVTDVSHIYGRYSDIDNQIHYNYRWVKADKFQYSVVRKAFFIRLMDYLLMGIAFISVFAAIYDVMEQIRYFTKNYRRTAKGNVLLNKTYALKNYLKDYSLIKNRSEQELILWEYYLVYAVALDVNKRVEDEVMQKLMPNK